MSKSVHYLAKTMIAILFVILLFNAGPTPEVTGWTELFGIVPPEWLDLTMWIMTLVVGPLVIFFNAPESK